LKKKLVIVFFAVISVLIIWNWDIINYGILQGYYQLRIVFDVKPVSDVLQDKSFPDSLKRKLLLIQEIRRFAIDSLGLHDSNNYTTLYDQKGQPILWLVKACPPYSLKPYLWEFPIAGTFSYKGFFRKEKSLKEEQKLKDMGLDTRIGTVSGWSTLGILKDPILSNMLYRSEGDLADLIIHELTHSTIFLKNMLQFNENLATFIGEEGALYYLQKKYGQTSKEYTDYKGGDDDSKKFYDHIMRGAAKLDSLYQSFTAEIPDTLKRRLKMELINNILNTSDTISFYNKANYRFLLSPDFKPNNAYFIGFQIYRADQSEFKKEFTEMGSGDLKKYIRYLKDKYRQ
jgi:predicted aminopeptidase